MRPSAVIPARYGASRFPGKPLATLAGRPLVQHVWERAMKSEAFERVLVATDDDRIEEAVRRFGGEVVRTSASCPSGTDRVAEVARAHPEVSHWVNVQGDEPLIATSSLQALAELVVQTRDALCTLVRPLKESERQVPHVVKAVVAADGRALYFSRADLPFRREDAAPPDRWAHLGLYGYPREVLLRLASLPPSPLELSEGLEQLRALEAGIPVRVAKVPEGHAGVDTPEDLLRISLQLTTSSAAGRAEDS